MDKEKKLTETASDELSALKTRIAELEKELDYEKFRTMAYDKMIDLAEKRRRLSAGAGEGSQPHTPLRPGLPVRWPRVRGHAETARRQDKHDRVGEP